MNYKSYLKNYFVIKNKLKSKSYSHKAALSFPLNLYNPSSYHAYLHHL